MSRRASQLAQQLRLRQDRPLNRVVPGYFADLIQTLTSNPMPKTWSS